jgi:hypothetical protein
VSMLPRNAARSKAPEECRYTCGACGGRGGDCPECRGAGCLCDVQVGRGLSCMLGRARTPAALAGVLDGHAEALETAEAMYRTNHQHAYADLLAIEAMTCRVTARRLRELSAPPGPRGGPVAAALRRLFGRAA